MLSRRHFCSMVWPFVVVHRLVVVAVINNRNNNHRTTNAFAFRAYIASCIATSLLRMINSQWIAGTKETRIPPILSSKFKVKIGFRFGLKLKFAKPSLLVERRWQDLGYDACTRATPKYLVMFPIFVYSRMCVHSFFFFFFCEHVYVTVYCVCRYVWERCFVECPACRNAFVEWVRAFAEACVPCASTRHDKYVYRARVLYPFRSVILRSEIRAFAYSRKDSFFPAHAPDARSAGPRPAGRGFVRRFNWRNRNGSTGILVVLASHTLPFSVLPFLR